MHHSDRRLSVCIPYYRASPDVLLRSVGSAQAALPDGAELLVVPSDPEAARRLALVDLPASVKVLEARGALDLVANWNRCITESTGDLIHLLHDDDAVSSDFYKTILELADRFPTAGLYGTWSGSLDTEEHDSNTPPDASLGPVLLAGDDAARFLLADDRHGCGNMVLVRSVIDRVGLFRPQFPYCPDEEAYLRYARDGGIALSQRTRYFAGVTEKNARLATWSKDDFVAVYLASRMEGADSFSTEMVQLAGSSSVRRVLSIVMSLATTGRRADAEKMLRALRREQRLTEGIWQIHLARVVLRLRLGWIVSLRRRLLRG